MGSRVVFAVVVMGFLALAPALPVAAQPAAVPAPAADPLPEAVARLAEALAAGATDGVVAALDAMADIAAAQGGVASMPAIRALAAAFAAMDGPAIVAAARAVHAAGDHPAAVAVLIGTAPLVEMIQLAIPDAPPSPGREWAQLAANPDPALPFVGVSFGTVLWELVPGAAGTEVGGTFILLDAGLAGRMAFAAAAGPDGAPGVAVVVTLFGRLAGSAVAAADGITAGEARTPAHVAYAASALDDRTFAAFIPAGDLATLPATPAFGLALTRADGTSLWLRLATGTSGATALAAALPAWQDPSAAPAAPVPAGRP
ncbi:MAG: hypothetical protein KIS68_16070 [Bauldia sp.]|nr:hypothetical protein [Bauldia sp.]